MQRRSFANQDRRRRKCLAQKKTRRDLRRRGCSRMRRAALLREQRQGWRPATSLFAWSGMRRWLRMREDSAATALRLLHSGTSAVRTRWDLWRLASARK
uniref:Uncharacterized protein n=1 Tax=Cucumis sativus TaxID=3659 RepID=A0A0A0L765_CUCSA